MSDALKPTGPELFRVWADIQYACAVVPFEHHADVTVWKLHYSEQGEPPLYQDPKNQNDSIADRDQAEVFIDGGVKWDGCSNFRFHEEGYHHFCGAREAEAVGELLRRVYELAQEAMPQHEVVGPHNARVRAVQ